MLTKWRLRDLFGRCFVDGKFPKPWKDGVLCLLRKVGRPAESPSGYRPIVLLNEAGKLFERLIASRLKEHLSSTGPDLSDAQFGFREGRSTIDALQRLKSLCQEAAEKGEGVLAVSFDIANAFNSLPHSTILEALRHHRVPPYLQALLADYLRDREVMFVNRDGMLQRRKVESGVPQGSVLGPLLWNLGYNWLLRGTLLWGMGVICYADDTLVTARGRNFAAAARLASVGGTLVAERIQRLGLRVALEKTEALFFPGPRQRAPSNAHIVVGGVRVEVKAQMKYLGLTLDARWQFGPHFSGLSPRLLKAAGSFSWLLPNLGGPRSKCRRLYAGILKSMALYGAPIWADALHRGKNTALLRRPQRAIAQRVARTYRTVSFAAACALAGTPPWELEAGVLSAVYHQTAERRALGERLAPSEKGAIRQEARELMFRQWKVDMARAEFGRRTLDALVHVIDVWVERPHGFLTFRLAQVLSGHGSFGTYLCRIGREESPSCHECGAAEDTAQHTLAVCPGWEDQRRVLRAAVGPDLMLPSVVRAMLGNDSAWRAMASFCEDVMLRKEAAEREREEDPLAPPLRRRRRGVRRRQYSRAALAPDGGQWVGGAGAPLSALHRPPASSDGNSPVFLAIPGRLPTGGPGGPAV